jgi:hypothetical protein
MSHDRRFHLRHCGQGADHQRARHADAKISCDQFVPNQAFHGVKFPPGQLQQIVTRVFRQVAQRDQSLFHNLREGKGGAWRRIREHQGDRFGHVTNGMVTFLQ